MLWFHPLPWARWSLVALLVAFAAWIELKPDATAPVPFATATLSPGDVIDETLVEFRDVPAGLVVGANIGEVVARPVQPGEPVLASHTDDTYSTIPSDWWVIPVELPDGAHVGDAVRLVLLDSGVEVEGVVAFPGSDDPFAAADGGVAVPSERASQAAVAAANTRLAVLISSG